MAVERISKLFKRPVEVTPEQLGAALMELTTESLNDFVDRVAKDRSLLGGVDAPVFFAELIALQAFGVRHALGRRGLDAAVAERVTRGYAARYLEFREAFGGHTLAPEEVEARIAAYAEVGKEADVARMPVGAPFAKYCGLPSPMAATSGAAMFRDHHAAVEKLLENATLAPA